MSPPGAIRLAVKCGSRGVPDEVSACVLSSFLIWEGANPVAMPVLELMFNPELLSVEPGEPSHKSSCSVVPKRV